MINFRTDWQALHTQLTTVSQDLQKVEGHLSPLNFLEGIKSRSLELARNLRQQNLHIIGSVNFTQILVRVGNRIDGVQYGLQSKSIDKPRLAEILSSTKADLEPALQEVETKLDRQDVKTMLQSAQGDRPISQESYNNLTDAMQTYVRQNNGAGEGLSDSDKSQSRDLIHMTEILKRNASDLANLKAQLNKASIDRSSDENFHLVQGPVLIGAALDVVRLKAAGIDFDTVYFPGIRYGFARKEETPRFYILRNQMLLAVIERKKGRFHMNLKGKSVPQKMQDENDRFKQISNDVVTMLQSKSGERYTQIGAERGKYIVNRQFPGTKFMLLMRRSVFERIGPFGSSNTLELPF